MLFQIFLLLILIFCSSSVIVMSPKLAGCTMFFAKYQESPNLPELLKEVARWKITLDKGQLLDFNGPKSVTKDIQKCRKIVQAKKSPNNNVLKLIVEDMYRHFTKHMKMENVKTDLKQCVAKAKSKSKETQLQQMVIHQKIIANMTAKNEPCISKVKEMPCPNGKVTKEQKDVEIVKWKQMAQQLEKKLETIRANNDQLQREFAKKLAEEKQISEKWHKQLMEKEQQLANCGNEKGSWKIATFLLICVSLLILAISISAALILHRHFIAQMTPHT